MTTHSRERALSERQFELLLEGATRIDDDFRSLQAQFLVVAAGRLGMRSSEIVHCRGSWIDWRNRRIVIPRQEDCHFGQGTGPCGSCRQAARQMVDHFDAEEISDRQRRFLNRHLEDGFSEGDELTLDEALDLRWTAKTDAAAREIPFDFSPRAELIIERFFDRFDAWCVSKTALNNRLIESIEYADDELEQGVTSPHGLRATAATYHVGRGLDTLPLQALMGWASLQTARYYVQSSADNTSRALHQIHSR